MDFRMELFIGTIRTWRLVLLYPCAMVLLAGANAVLMGGVLAFFKWVSSFTSGVTLVFVLSILGYGIVFLLAGSNLHSSGKNTAEAMGARQIPPDSDVQEERRLYNITEEIALASNLPVPSLYMIDNEQAVNAFTAGSSVENAAIGVTRGTVEHLNREELQAVIAHTFSRVYNGDLLLDFRLAQMASTLLAPLTVISAVFAPLTGTTFLLCLGNEDTETVEFVLALMLYFCLYFSMAGSVIGLWLEKNITHERTLMADAAAQQFTRSWAFAAALAKVTRLESTSCIFRDKRSLQNAMAPKGLIPNLPYFSHLFLFPVKGIQPGEYNEILHRIRRLDPTWNGTIGPETESIFDRDSIEEPEPIIENGTGETARNDAPMPDSDTPDAPCMPITLVDSPLIPLVMGWKVDNSHQMLPPPLLSEAQFKNSLEQVYAACRVPLDASCLALAMFLSSTPNLKNVQFQGLSPDFPKEAVLLYNSLLDDTPKELRLSLLGASAPALRNLSARQYKEFHESMLRFIHADGVFSTEEWVLYLCVTTLAGADHEPHKQPLFINAAKRKDAVKTLLATLARLAPASAQEAFTVGLLASGLPVSIIPPPASPEMLTESLHVQRLGSAAMKDAFLHAAVAVILHDNMFSREEATLLRLMTLCIGCPFPASRWNSICGELRGNNTPDDSRKAGPEPAGPPEYATIALIMGWAEHHDADREAELLRCAAASRNLSLWRLCTDCREPQNAGRIILTLFLSDNSSVKKHQTKTLAGVPNLKAIYEKDLIMRSVPEKFHLPLAEVAASAVRNLSDSEYAELDRRMQLLLFTDNAPSPRAWILFQCVTALAGRGHEKNDPPPPDAAGIGNVALPLLAALARLTPKSPEKAYTAGLLAASLPPGPLPSSSPEVLNESLQKLRQESDAVKEIFLCGAAAVIAHDGKFSVAEAMLLRAITLGMGCPLSYETWVGYEKTLRSESQLEE